jgi:DNA-binding NarL/FixJ family response regulator
MMIDVVIADDQAMVRSGLRALLESADDIRVVGEATDGVEAVDAVRRLQPHVALVDVRMPRLDGIAAAQQISALGQNTRTLVLTTFDLDEYVFAALRAGAAGFLLKDATADELLDAVRVVAAGNSMLAPAVTRRVIEAFAATAVPPASVTAKLELLSPRETEVLRLLAAGHSNPDIALTLFLGEATVKTHISHILAKLRVRDRLQAVIFAYESGLIKAGAPPNPP